MLFELFKFRPQSNHIKKIFGLVHLFSSHNTNTVNTFPGARASYIGTPTIFSEITSSVPIFKLINADGLVEHEKEFPTMSKELVTEMFRSILFLNTLDKILYESQRQGRISFYMTNFGEEAIQVGSAAALKPTDLIYAQYREAGVLLWRGFSLSQFIDQCYGNIDDEGRGKQMPVHYGSKVLNFVTISSPLATQIPQAAGAAYTFKNMNDKIVVCYFGDGAASEGDAHAAFNFASTLDCPVIFFCRNNGFAISTPTREQYNGDGIAGRALAYGIATIRVDGTDIFAVYTAMKKARDFVKSNKKPVIVEAMTYRVGHHSTSDDSSSYRSVNEEEIWKTIENPINKLRNYMKTQNWWNESEEIEFLKDAKLKILIQIAASEKKLKPNWKEMFNDVYSDMPSNLRKQSKQLESHIGKYEKRYTLINFK